MFSTAGIAVLVVTAVFGLCQCQTYGGSGNGTGNGTDIQVYTEIKNCTQEAIYYTSAYLENNCVLFNKQICFDNFEKCINSKGYNTKKAEAICQQELGPNYLSITNEDCEALPSNYLNAVQSTCCTKTKAVEQVPGKTFRETQDIIESCYDKVNCPDTDSCSEQIQTNSSTTNGGNMGTMGDSMEV